MRSNNSLMWVSFSPKYKWANHTSNLLSMIILMSVPIFMYFHHSMFFYCSTLLQFICFTNENLGSFPFWYYGHCCNDHSNTWLLRQKKKNYLGYILRYYVIFIFKFTRKYQIAFWTSHTSLQVFLNTASLWF